MLVLVGCVEDVEDLEQHPGYLGRIKVVRGRESLIWRKGFTIDAQNANSDPAIAEEDESSRSECCPMKFAVFPQKACFLSANVVYFCHHFAEML